MFWKKAKAQRSFSRKSRRIPLRGIELLEQRTLLSSSPANVFAHFGGVLDAPGEVDTVKIHLTPENFTLHSNVTLGFVLKPAQGVALAPNPVRINSLGSGGVS